MTYAGAGNIRQEMSVFGEYINNDYKELVGPIDSSISRSRACQLEFVAAKTPRNASFASTMTTTSTIKLCTRRPIVNHPHYEDVGVIDMHCSLCPDECAGIRNRTFHVYQIFSRKSDEQVHAILADLSVDYVVLEWMWCLENNKPCDYVIDLSLLYSHHRPGCSMQALYDREFPEFVGRESFCQRWLV